MAAMILICLPFAQRRPPIFQNELLGIFLSLTPTITTLGGCLSDPVLPLKVNFNPFSDPWLDDLFRAPRPALQVLVQTGQMRSNGLKIKSG